ncbi:Fis family transcriptional regulator [Sphingopyxis sp. H038]|uniref:sigma-54-dependent transcriptional regulator n=1 Tax=unclassified Sphingopyxis TaxID=2614943 RepID=UPI000730ACC4|nr:MULTISPECIES: sigma-54 dependent transcriptional regulator [unclassified Sphingopyxis]KTD99980.1 Fis family transcriptional regulator [Sphingopyxis sp. H012]KTE07165.1 Fis family transcriptional regulator [Sphingopyxis sp. H053]KTE09007.1 Fis family transcriptional regulator [Sphingopyxis sp. H093]KTE25285.1 Fis family transcriptional regulator [Sphingopyxis sp. H080]KTE36309.1 Fis family transcriptional regulator [Sphingopyxis sp. H038]
MSFFTGEQTIFFVDDDAALREANVQTLDLAGLAVEAFPDAQSVLPRIETGFSGIVVTDIRMPGMDGLELRAAIHAIDPDIPVILITGHADVAMAVRALHDGAFDFLAKPFAADHLVGIARRALAHRALILDNRRLTAAAAAIDSPLIGESPAMVRLRETITQLAQADIDVLIEGETGTGKELVAHMLHRQSRRSPASLVAVNCAALPQELAEAELFGSDLIDRSSGKLGQAGRIRSAHRGTLFLDEIDTMHPSVQAKLLRVIEEREVQPIGASAPEPVDLRVVAATKTDLMDAVRSGDFREDLYYRLHVVKLRIPPLRERRSDIPQTFAFFLDEAAAKMGMAGFRIDDGIRRHLVEHDWPGNVRELKNFAYSVVLDLPSDPGLSAMPADAPLAERVRRFEATIIHDTMAQTRGNIAETMARLGLPRKTLYDKMQKLGIDPKSFRA